MTVRIGVDLGGTKIEGIVLAGASELWRTRVATPRDDYPATIDAVRRLVGDLEARAARPASVGIGIPGAIDPETMRVKNANSVWLIGRPLQADLETALARPVRVANDANCFAISEAADGAGTGASVVFGVIIGTGTGAGVVINGAPLTGRHAIAGEWGHNPLPWPDADEWPGPSCYCGRTGCIETFLSGPGLARDFATHAGESVAPAAIVTRAEAGDVEAARAVARYEHRMARALASIINVLDPEIIVLGGGMSNVTRLYDNVPLLWGQYVFGTATVSSDGMAHGQSRRPRVQTRLVPARHGDSSGVRGAAWLWPATA